MTKPIESSYLKYLPSIYQLGGPEHLHGGNDLGKFLLPFEQILAEFENLLSGIDHYADPQNTPEDFLPWLASWVALELDHTWPQDKQRQQIAKAIDLYRLRGTVQGLKQAIAIYDEDLEVAVVEHAMPSGMQIGVSSRIGGFEPTYLFAISGDFVDDFVSGLDECRVTEGLRQQFKDHGVALGALEISVKQTKNRWGIVDFDTDEAYQIRRKDRTLSVHAERLHIQQNQAANIQHCERALPVHCDYYVVEPPNDQTAFPAQSDNPGEDDPTRYYYRTDGVEWIRKDQSDDKQSAVWLKLTTGEIRLHEPATVSRLHGIPDNRYRLKVDDADIQFIGDTLVVNHAEDPFQFIVDIGIPTGWLFRFDIDLIAFNNPFLEKALDKAIGELFEDKVVQSQPDEAGRKWNVETMGGEHSVERTGWALHLSGKAREAPIVMLQFDAIDFRAVGFSLAQILLDQGIVFPSEPKFEWESESHRWLKIGDEDNPPAYLAVRRGSRLFVYQFVEDSQRQRVAETRGLAKDDGPSSGDASDASRAFTTVVNIGEGSMDEPLKTMAAKHSRAIHAIVDDVKPSHTQYTLRFGLRPGPVRLAPLPIGEWSIAQLGKLAMPQEDGPVPRDIRDELAKHRIWLSDKPTLRKETADRWRIDDRDAHRLYVRVKIDNTLEVFQRSLIDESMVIG